MRPKQIIFLLLSIVSSQLCFAQNSKSDSLLNVLENYQKEDTNRIKTLLTLSWDLTYSKPQEGLKYAKEAMRTAEDINWKLGILKAYRQFGNLYYNMDELPKAVLNYQKGLKIAEAENLDHLSNSFYNNLGNIHSDMGDYDKALKYYNQVLTFAIKSDDTVQEINALCNIGLVYSETNRMEDGLVNIKRALDLAIIGDHHFFVGALNLNLGRCYKDLKVYDQSIFHYTQAIEIAKKSGQSQIQALASSNLASVYIILEDYSLAKEFSLKGIALGETSNAVEWQSEAWDKLRTVYELEGDSAKAYHAYKKYVFLRDSLINEDKKSEVTKQLMQFEMEKRDVIATEEIKRQKQIKQFAVGGIVVLFLGFLFAYFLYKKRRDAIDLKKAAEFKSKVANTELKALRSQVNPHFIFNALNSISDCMVNQDMETANNQLIKFSNLTRSILENSENKWTELKEDLEMMNQYIDIELLRLNNKFTYSIDIAENIDSENVVVPPLIAQPLIENSIWHGLSKKDHGGELIIRISLEDQMLKYAVIDNGKGMEKEAQRKKNQSMGLAITKSRLEIINTTEKSNSRLVFEDVAEGVYAIIYLPIKTRF